MGDRRRLRPDKTPGGKKDPDFSVTVMCSCTIKIYGTTDPDEAKIRAVNRIRGLFDGIDSDIYIPRAIVIPWGLSQEEAENIIKEQTEGRIQRVQQEEVMSQINNPVDETAHGDADKMGDTSRRFKPEFSSNEEISDLLAGVSVMVSAATVATWTQDQKIEALEWMTQTMGRQEGQPFPQTPDFLCDFLI